MSISPPTGGSIAIAADHAGFEQKQQLVAWLRERDYRLTDFGCDSAERVDYPDYAAKVAEAVSSGEAEVGVLICGTGIGMAIVANKFDGVRAANVTDPSFAELAREHNHANVLTLSARFATVEQNKAIIAAFLATPYGGGRHATRVEKIARLEQTRAERFSPPVLAVR